MRCFEGTARASGCPEDRNILWTNVNKIKLQKQNGGCMKIRLEVRKCHPADTASASPAGICPSGLVLPALSNTQALRCLAESHCLSGAPHVGSKRSPQRSSFHEQENQGVQFPMDLRFEKLCACITISLSGEISEFLSSL